MVEKYIQVFYLEYITLVNIFSSTLWMLVRLNFLLVARCSLVFARCSLVFARCSLLFARSSLLFARCSLLWNKIFVNRKKNSLTITKFSHRYFLANFWDFGDFFWMVVFKVFSTYKTIFKVGIVTNIGWIDITLISLLQYLDTF